MGLETRLKPLPSVLLRVVVRDWGYVSHHVTHIVICKIYRNLLKKKIRKLRKNKKKNRNNNILSGKHVTLKTRQTRATGAGFWGVTICQPAPAPVTTRDCNPHGFVNPWHSLSRVDDTQSEIIELVPLWLESWFQWIGIATGRPNPGVNRRVELGLGYG